MSTDAEFLRVLAELGEGQDLGNKYSAKRMRLLEIAGRQHADGNLSPWDEDRSKGETSGWGPGPIEDFIVLTQQGEKRSDPFEAIDIFIKRNVPRNHQPHLLDSDDNDGEYLRRIVRTALRRARKRGRKEGREGHVSKDVLRTWLERWLAGDHEKIDAMLSDLPLV